MGLDHSPPVSKSAKYFKIIGPGRKKIKKTKRWVTSLLHRGCSQGKSKNNYKFNLLTGRDRTLYWLGL